jgi:guanosine-3',5'-bis(diphosphate) 3'-pyrophosphohydrolase
MPSFENTVRIIQKAHEGQTDKQGEEYWKHPVQVAATVASLFNGTEDEQLAALLHDVTEDTEYTLQDLQEMGFSPYTLEIVKWMDKANFSGTYIERIENMAQNAPVGALKVKLADNMSNMREGATESLKKRYVRSMEILKAALAERG